MRTHTESMFRCVDMPYASMCCVKQHGQKEKNRRDIKGKEEEREKEREGKEEETERERENKKKKNKNPYKS